MGFFKNIGAVLNVVDLNIEPKVGVKNYININGVDYMFVTAVDYGSQRCLKCIFRDICCRSIRDLGWDGLYVNGKDTEYDHHTLIPIYGCSPLQRRDAESVYFAKAD